jgi:PKD repeat protein
MTALVAIMATAGAIGSLAAHTASAGGERGGLPDLMVEQFYNVTPVIVGDDSYFNVTIKNQGTAAYLMQSCGDLEVYTYRDSETDVASYAQVYEDIYVGKNVTLNMKVRYDSTGHHTLKVVIDELRRVQELSDSNNEATTGFEASRSEENRPPVADGGNDRTGYKGMPMLFSGLYSTDPDADRLTYTWDFGDGARGTGMTTNHTYAAVGNYSASLTVSDSQLTDRDNFTVQVIDAPVNHPPKAVIRADSTSAKVGEQLSLDGRGSSDPDAGDAMVLDWDFDSSDGVDDWVRGPTVMTNWSKAGQYTVTLRVSDGKAQATATLGITVTAPTPTNKPPTANAGANFEATTGLDFTIVGTGSDEDGTVKVYEWDVNGDGTYETYGEQDGRLVWRFKDAGPQTLRLRVTDDRGATDTSEVMVTVTEPPKEDKPTPGFGPVIAGLALCAAAVLAMGLGRDRWRPSRT